MRYDPSLTVREALRRFYRDNGFKEEDLDKNFYRVRLGGFVAYLYNPALRRAALPLHDIEHVLYEVDTTFAGEAEISAIGLANSGKKPLATYVFGPLGVLTGLVVDRSRTLRGFWRGLRRRSLHSLELGEALLDMRLGEVRQALGILIR